MKCRDGEHTLNWEEERWRIDVVVEGVGEERDNREAMEEKKIILQQTKQYNG